MEKFYPRVRDRDDIQVLKCPQSGIIFLSRSNHMDLAFYENKTVINETKNASLDIQVGNKILTTPGLDDAVRRAKDFGSYIEGKNWLDFGTGYGAILDELKPRAKTCCGLEPNLKQRTYLANKGYTIYKSLPEISRQKFDVITLFHVFEHLSRPIETLVELKDRLNKNGRIIIEVPHARDFLIETAHCESFKEFTFWSEHLILHTKNSLDKFVRQAGFDKISISGYQRYPLSNHLHWLALGKPGGHKHWSHLNNPELENSYEKLLQSIDQTDTLVATAIK